jgi:hypothetical protein
MILREYKPEDKKKCIEIFQSNYPKFFDKSELSLFINWLDHQVGNSSTYQSPTYTNSEKDAYFVVEVPETGIVGCGGFYIVKDKNEARLALKIAAESICMPYVDGRWIGGTLTNFPEIKKRLMKLMRF